MDDAGEDPKILSACEIYYFIISLQTALRNKPAIVGVLRSKPRTEFQYVFPPLTLRLQETLEPVNGSH